MGDCDTALVTIVRSITAGKIRTLPDTQMSPDRGVTDSLCLRCVEIKLMRPVLILVGANYTPLGRSLCTPPEPASSIFLIGTSLKVVLTDLVLSISLNHKLTT